MSPVREKSWREVLQTCGWACLCGLALAGLAIAQAVPYARTYQKSREEVEAALKELQAYSGEKLPIVEGFVAGGDKPLERFERAFYQFTIELIPGNAGATIVQVSAKITAWYADRDPAKSGYEALPSNGRLELDLLDRLTEKFGGKTAAAMARPPTNSTSTISVPKPKLDLSGVPRPAISTPASPPDTASAAGTTELSGLRAKREAAEKRMRELSEELQGLQEIQKHQAHPTNLVVVKKTGTPVLTKPAEGVRVLMNADAEDEFEFLDAEGEWIHVQISGPSRGYIRRSSLELPEAIAQRLKSSNASVATEDKSGPFRIVREESSVFPGDWEPLKGKIVKIYTVQPVSQDPKETGTSAKLAYAKTLFQKAAEGVASSPPGEGIVVIFDSADGGIVGATLGSAKQFAAGTLSAETFWKQCYLDPPEAFQDSRKP